jgi:dTDP-4-dehydrorhamnose reductase
MKIPILATGLSGLVGTRVYELLRDKYEIFDMSLSTGIDITDYESLEKEISNTESKIILHMAAKTDVDSCEDDKIYGEDGSAWSVNVVGTQNIIKLAKKYKKKVIYISTDFVFDGTKEYYTENDKPNPVNWYGYTKYEGEKIVLNTDIPFLILRIAYPYKAKCIDRMDFVSRIINKMKQNQPIYGVSDHIFTPTFIDDIALGLEHMISKNFEGIYHMVGSQSISVLDAVMLISEIFGIKTKIIPIKREEFFKEKAYRPFKLALKNDKIIKIGLKFLGFKDGLIKIKKSY